MSSIARNPAEDFRVGVVSPPTAIDPRTAKDTGTHTLLRQIFEPPFVIRAAKSVPLLFATTTICSPAVPLLTSPPNVQKCAAGRVSNRLSSQSCSVE